MAEPATGSGNGKSPAEMDKARAALLRGDHLPEDVADVSTNVLVNGKLAGSNRQLHKELSIEIYLDLIRN